MRTGPVGVAVIGAGVISKEYLTTLTQLPDVRVHAVADLLPEAAAERAAEFDVAAHGPVSAALEHPEAEIVLNLTIPSAHAEVGRQALAAGKHVWNEKPLAADRSAAADLLDVASTAGLRVGCAPDTFLGPGLQAAYRAIADGRIGVPTTAVFVMQTPGPESWHPNPDFLYAPGGGPLFDMGPYYLTTLVQVFGPVAEVAAIGSRALDERVIATGDRAGETINVHIPTHVGVLLRFTSGQSAQGIFSFESPRVRMGFVEVTGTEATISLPDPNKFEGDINLWRAGTSEPAVTLIDKADVRRGLGVLEMARAIRGDQPHRASGELAYHVLDIMSAIDEATTSDAFVPVTSRVEPATTLPAEWDPHAATL